MAKNTLRPRIIGKVQFLQLFKLASPAGAETDIRCCFLTCVIECHHQHNPPVTHESFHAIAFVETKLSKLIRSIDNGFNVGHLPRKGNQ